MASMNKIDGYVWCDLHGAVHDDTTNPYDDTQHPTCRKINHWTLYSRVNDER